MQRELGWSRTTLTLLPIISVISAFMLPVFGCVIDRIGARSVGIGGLIGLASGYCALILLPLNLAILYAIVTFIGLVAAASGPMPWTRGVAGWFKAHRGMALGLSLCGTSIISALMMPILAAILVGHNWRWGYAALMGAVVMAGLPAALLLFRERPANMEQPVDGARKVGFLEILKVPQFWLLSGCFAFVSVPIGGFVVHMVPILTSKGLSTTDAAAAASGFSLAIAFGRIVGGFLLDRIWPPLVAATCFLLPIVGTVVIGAMIDSTHNGLMIALTAAILLGFAQGAEVDFIAFFAARYFPYAAYARTYGLLSMTTYIVSAGGALGFSMIYDRNGDYGLAIEISAICYLLGGLLILGLDHIPVSPPSRARQSVRSRGAKFAGQRISN
ncbi:hypothetical protein A0J57_04130 [Sphingobium sp. 22B]|nr:hypothetical protein A0J57_04130 [Sphingobium sp. 22B]OAP33517.1 hypothetical protein A8O16_03350 [Sphingobium sp. 20006FA]